MKQLPPSNSPYSRAYAKIRGRRCNPCDRIFPTRADLERHQQEKHRVKFIRQEFVRQSVGASGGRP